MFREQRKVSSSMVDKLTSGHRKLVVKTSAVPTPTAVLRSILGCVHRCVNRGAGICLVVITVAVINPASHFSKN